jgi:hypothetical protein
MPPGLEELDCVVVVQVVESERAEGNAVVLGTRLGAPDDNPPHPNAKTRDLTWHRRQRRQVCVAVERNRSTTLVLPPWGRACRPAGASSGDDRDRCRTDAA